ncbi:MAG: hypothetical protein LUC45_05145, partial [Paraprevotella sp.]|nr:hypothetical protein [Paraprevotella sp.]
YGEEREKVILASERYRKRGTVSVVFLFFFAINYAKNPFKFAYSLFFPFICTPLIHLFIIKRLLPIGDSYLIHLKE